MDILPYIVLLVTIFGHCVTGKSLNRNELKIVVDKLYYTSAFSNVIKEEEDQEGSCTGLELHECYEAINKLYENHFHATIVPKIYNTIIERLKKFNVVVLSLFDKIESIDLPSKELERVYSSIYFDNSKAYCPIGFLHSLELSQINMNHALRDYIFFHIINKTGQGKNLKDLVNGHFENRKDEFKDNNTVDKNASYKLILEKLDNVKNEINNYSQVFCELGTELKRRLMTAEEWLWSKLNDSYIFNQLSVDGENLLESKVHKIETEDKSLKEIFDEQSQEVLFENITDNYDKISKMIDNYVLKVMCRKVFSMILSDLKASINRNTSGTGGKSNRPVQTTFISQALIFENSLTFYCNLPNSSFDEETISFVTKVLTDIIRVYFLQFNNPTDWDQLKNSISEVETYLSENDKLQIFNNNSDEAQKKSDNNIVKYHQEIRNINIVLARLIEVKMEP